MLGVLLQNRLRLFWLLNISGWAAYGFANYLAGRYWGEEWGLPLYRLVSSATGFVISLGLRQIYKSIWEQSVWRQALVVIVSAYLCAAVMAVLCNAALWELYPEHYTDTDRHLMHYFKGVTGLFYMFICWSGLYYGFKFYEGMQLATQRALRANALAHESQLKMLRYQLNPHFLFNTLNAISTLILEKNTIVANDMVARLSNFLRYSLDNDPMQKTTLAQEINALKLYLDIEKVRFEDRLNLVFDLEEPALDGLIPSLLLQPLVENAIKYAIAKSEQGGTIAIRARVFARELLLEVSDDGPGIPGLTDGGALPHNGAFPHNGTGQNNGTGAGNGKTGCGVGVRNTRERLRELYGDAHSFQLSNVEPHGLQISIRIPFQTDGQRSPLVSGATS